MEAENVSRETSQAQLRRIAQIGVDRMINLCGAWREMTDQTVIPFAVVVLVDETLSVRNVVLTAPNIDDMPPEAIAAIFRRMADNIEPPPDEAKPNGKMPEAPERKRRMKSRPV
jgi:hypothetical protein